MPSLRPANPFRNSEKASGYAARAPLHQPLLHPSSEFPDTPGGGAFCAPASLRKSLTFRFSMARISYRFYLIVPRIAHTHAVKDISLCQLSREQGVVTIVDM